MSSNLNNSLNSLDFLANFSSSFNEGKSFSLAFIAIESIAVGNTSLVDCDLFTWSLGCIGFLFPFYRP